MWPFKRKAVDKQLPAEMQEYFNAEKRQRVGVAWFLAFATLVGTLMVAMGIFFGGKWVYRSISQPAATPKTTVQTTDSNTTKTAKDKSSKPTNPPATPTQNTDITVEDISSDEGVVDDGATTVSTASKPTALVNTGPVNVIKVFWLVTLFATVGHNLLFRRKIAYKN